MAGEILLRYRLFDPAEVIGRETLDAVPGFGGIERLVEIEHQRGVVTDQLANAFHAPLVIGGIAVAALDLDAAKALLQRAAQRLLVGVGFDRAIAVIGLDRFGRS